MDQIILDSENPNATEKRSRKKKKNGKKLRVGPLNLALILRSGDALTLKLNDKNQLL
jgi:hypothetical protein